MNFKKRLTSVLIICVCLIVVILIGNSLWNNRTGEAGLISHKDTIHLWYTDENLTDYLNSKAVAYYDETDTRVELHLVSGLEYLEQINQASLDDSMETPDVYIVTNDSLEKAYLAGLATEIQGADLVEDSSRFSDTARNAVTYKGKYVGFIYSTGAISNYQTFFSFDVEYGNVDGWGKYKGFHNQYDFEVYIEEHFEEILHLLETTDFD